MEAIDQGNDTYLVPDFYSAELDVESDSVELKSIAAVAAVERRFDLPPSHPLYGQRVLKCVPSGSDDILMKEDGILEDAAIALAPVEIE